MLVCSMLMEATHAGLKEKTVGVVDNANGWTGEVTDPTTDESDESTETKFEGDDPNDDDSPRTIVMGH
ncbi:hypothetical protein BVRB_9g204450 [Beta vulgaris subsp. vulgaris]|nr:hypothetical protein BVRB_9g204450 [Beta vulgaris subsp. vulgaris]